MPRRLRLLFLLGVWSGATVFMWLVATQNFAVVQEILENRQPEFAAKTSPLSDEDLRLAMRYQASEVNRLFFEGWGYLQVPIAFAALWLTWRSGEGRWLTAASAVMLLIVLLLGLYVVPETVRLGRLLDFVPRDPAPPAGGAFWRLHHTYTALDMVKFLVAIGSAAVLVRRGSLTKGVTRAK